jgi:signal transduction histidine kinase
MDTQEGSFFTTYILATAILFVVAVYFTYILVRQHKQNLRLAKQKLTSEIKASEAERSAIATELHNDIAPHLIGIKMRLASIEGLSDHPQVEACNHAISECVKQIKNLSRAISPISIYMLNFKEGIRYFIEQHGYNEMMNIEIIDETTVDLGKEANNQVYRILQEIVLNTIKHAQAKDLVIEISETEKELLIRTQDNGVGFTFADNKRKKMSGMGLLSIENRIDYLNGTLIVNSEAKSGAQYNIRIPKSMLG